MRRQKALIIYPLFLLFALVNHVNAADGFTADQFLGSPLLILAAILVIDLIALVYRKIRK
jgi:cadmium resistance protein CadD (predicted permease)